MRRLPFHYGWVVLAVTLVTLATMAGFRSMVAVLIVPLHDEFGWTTASIGLAAGLNLMLYGLGGPFAAAMYDRFGLKRCVVVAIAAVAAGALATLTMDAAWQFTLLWGVVMGVATGAVSVTLAAVVANRWFVARRGLATGILTAANATGQLSFLPLLAWVTSAFGWRYAVAGIAVTAICVILPLVALLLRDRPADIGLRPYGAVEDDPPPPPAGNPFLAAFGEGLLAVAGSRTFWLLTGSFFICGVTTNGVIGTHLIPAAMGHGMTEVAAAGLLAVIGVFDLVGTLVVGLAHRPLRPAQAALLVLRPAWALSARAAGGDRGAGSRARRVRRLLRARLGGDGAADGSSHRGHVRAGARRHCVRLDLRVAPARRRRRGIRGRPVRDPARHVRAGVRRRRRAVARRRGTRAPHRTTDVDPVARDRLTGKTINTFARLQDRLDPAPTLA